MPAAVTVRIMSGDGDGFELVRLFLVVVPALVALVATAAGLRKWLRHRRITAEGESTTAVVTGNQRHAPGEGRMLFRPVVAYRTTTGQEVSTVLEDQPSHREHLPGTEYPVAYDPADPSRPIVARSITGQLIATFAVAVLFLAFAALAYRLTS